MRRQKPGAIRGRLWECDWYDIVLWHPVWSVCDVLQKYAWTGHNNFFIKGNIDSLSVGAGE